MSRLCMYGNKFLLLFLLFLYLPGYSSAEENDSILKLKLKHKNDLILMENGDRNTGEIKKMEFGVLYLKSDRAADTLKLDWERVISVESIARYEFESSTKDIYIGTIVKVPASELVPGELQILQDQGGTVHLKIKDIIAIHEIGRSFLSRINLSLDAGISFTSANERAQTNFNLNTSFRKPKYSGSLNVSSIFSTEQDVSETARHEVQVTANRYLSRNWDAVFLTAFLHDSQQDLHLRTTIGGGLQRTFVETNRTLFYAIGGLVYTKEDYFEIAQSDRNNAEALAAIGFSTYRFRGSSFNGILSVFPSLSDPGRVRVDTNFNWKWDIVGDLYWRISFIDNYDNRPPENGIHNNLSITSTIGWSF